MARSLGSMTWFWQTLREKISQARHSPEVDSETGADRERFKLVQTTDTKGTIPDILRWANSFDIHAKQWLILGKGPSYSLVEEVDLERYYTCSLNHVLREHPVNLAHIIDIDVVTDCSESIERNARLLILPFFPHVKQKPTKWTIYDFVNSISVLRSMHDQKRLVWYNLSTSKTQVDCSPIITAKFFSAEAAVNILANCGVKTIRSLGVDGGSNYAPHYHDLEGKTLLANKHPSFDRQFENIAKTIRTKNIDYAPLHKESPIRVFVGTDKTQMLAARVLEYSIKKHASMTVDFVPMIDLPVPIPKDPANRPRTGFSFSRFLIPSLCGYKGRALYLDADMLVLSDISKIWDMNMDGADVLCAEQPSNRGRVRQYSVMLLNCSRLSWKIDEIVAGLDVGRYDYVQLMHDLCLVSEDRIESSIPYEWNSLEFFDKGNTCLIHYTDMPTQPWVSLRNTNGLIWYNALREAILEGFISKIELYREVEQSHVSPELPKRIGLAAHNDHERLSKAFVPPYQRFSKN
jgi:hypothetical protein